MQVKVMTEIFGTGYHYSTLFFLPSYQTLFHLTLSQNIL